MGYAYLYGAEGGGSSMSYDIACQTSEPSKKEGRIWIKSNVPMSQFQIAFPWESAPIGSVAIPARVGGTAPAADNTTIQLFNGKISSVQNLLNITPFGCQQVQDSAGNWVDVEACICHNSTWVDFTTYYLLNGTNRCEANTGGWDLTDYATLNTAYKYTTAVDSDDGSYITLNMTKNTTARGWYVSKNMIDFPGVKTIYIEYSQAFPIGQASGQGAWLSVSPSRAGTNSAASTASVYLNAAANVRTTASLDVSSLTFPLYVRVGALSVNAYSMNIYKIWAK